MYKVNVRHIAHHIFCSLKSVSELMKFVQSTVFLSTRLFISKQNMGFEKNFNDLEKYLKFVFSMCF